MTRTTAQSGLGAALEGESRAARLPPAATAVALVALAALLSTQLRPRSPHVILLPQLAVLILGTYVTRVRLPRQAIFVWTIRFVLYSLVIFTAKLENRGLYRWYLKPEYTNVVATLMGVELAIQYWLPRAAAPVGPVLATSGFIFTFATNTFESKYIVPLAPLFVLCAFAAFRGFRPRAAPGESRGQRSRMRLWRGVFAVASLGLGILIVIGFREFGKLTERITISPTWWRPNVVRVGFSGAPRLDPSFNIRPSAQRVMRVAGLTGEAHLRGLCFEDYSNNQWGPSGGGRDYVPVSPQQLGAGARGQRYTITRWIDRMHLMYAPLNAAGIGLIGGSSGQWNQDTRIVRDDSQASGEYIYQTIIAPTADFQGPLCGPLGAKLRAQCLDIPRDIDPRVLALARQVTSGVSAPRQQAAALERYLQKNYPYSLDVRGVQGDRLSDFVLNKRPAHCQYFASALVMMLRAVGIPARLVVGYYAHEPEGRDAIVVRQRDAHAWTEAWIEGVGWIELDATPATGRPDQAYPPVSGLRKAWEWISDIWSAFADWVGGLTVTKVLVMLAAVTGLLIAIQWVRLLVRRRRKSAGRGDEYASPNAELKSLAAGFDTLLSRSGIPCAAHSTWRQHIASVAADAARRRLKLDLELARLFVGDYELARFGPQRDESAIARLREIMAKIERSA